MVAGCPFDRNVLFCVMRYEPELLLLFFLAFVCACCLWKFMG
jgi:hypothetical protein